MMSAKMATPGHLYFETVFWNKDYDIIISVDDVTNKILSRDSNYIADPQFYKDLTRKTAFLEGCSWFKFNSLGLALGTNLKFYTSVAKELKLKVRRFWGLIPTFVEITGEKLVRGGPLWPRKPSRIGLKALRLPVRT